MKRDNKRLIALGQNGEEYHFIVKDSANFGYRRHMLQLGIEVDDDNFMMISCNGVTYPVEITNHKQNCFEVMVNGVSYSFTVETPFSLKRKRLLSNSEHQSRIERVKSPMPGKVLNILINEGQQINSGDALLVLEAMKMQNTLISSSRGIVKKVSIAAGDVVGKNDLLVEIDTV